MIGPGDDEGSVMSQPSGAGDPEHFFRYTCAESSAGRILVVMSDDGVVDVIRGDSRAELLSAALSRHPGAGMIPDKGVHPQWVAAIVKRIEQPGGEYGFPLDDGPHTKPRAAAG
jgi:hypothetical protein